MSDTLAYINANSQLAFTIDRNVSFVMQSEHPTGLIRLTGFVPAEVGSFICSEADNGEQAFAMIRKLREKKKDLVRFNQPAESSSTDRINPKSLDEKNRTAEIILLTEDPIPTFDFSSMDVVDESLVLAGVELQEQIPLLDSHQRSSVEHIIGSIRNLRISGGAVLGRVYFGTGDLADRIFQNIIDGHLTDVSVGAARKETEFLPSGQRKTFGSTMFVGPLKLVTKSKLIEGSLVVIGADPTAKIL